MDDDEHEARRAAHVDTGCQGGFVEGWSAGVGYGRAVGERPITQILQLQLVAVMTSALHRLQGHAPQAQVLDTAVALAKLNDAIMAESGPGAGEGESNGD